MAGWCFRGWFKSGCTSSLSAFKAPLHFLPFSLFDEEDILTKGYPVLCPKSFPYFRSSGFTTRPPPPCHLTESSVLCIACELVAKA